MREIEEKVLTELYEAEEISDVFDAVEKLGTEPKTIESQVIAYAAGMIVGNAIIKHNV